MPKKKPRAKAVTEADTALRNYLRARDPACITCGSTENLQVSHYVTKGAGGYRYRWSEVNANMQCSACHVRFHRVSPYDYTEAIVARHGVEAVKAMELRGPVKYTTADIMQIAIAYREKLKDITE